MGGFDEKVSREDLNCPYASNKMAGKRLVTFCSNCSVFLWIEALIG
jgi:hypothetical protein